MLHFVLFLEHVNYIKSCSIDLPDTYWIDEAGLKIAKKTSLHFIIPENLDNHADSKRDISGSNLH